MDQQINISIHKVIYLSFHKMIYLRQFKIVDNVFYYYREMNGGRGMLAPGQDVGNRNKFDSISEAVKTSSQIPQGFKDLIAKRCEEKGIIFRLATI